MQDRIAVASALDDIALLLSLSRQNAWKARAYRQGAELVRGLGDELGPLVTKGELERVEGIGQSLAREISELWNNGSSALLQRLTQEAPPGTAELGRIPGMTLRRIHAVQAGLQISSVHELEEACTAARVRELPGFGVKTEQRLLAAIARLNEKPASAGRVLLSEAWSSATKIERHVIAAGAAERVEIAGAARRGEEIVSELEMLFVSSTPDALWAALEDCPFVLSVNREQERAQLGVGVPLRVHVAPVEAAGTWLVLATGGETHVRALIERASARDVALSATTGASAFRDERALYAALELPYVPPELRGDAAFLEPTRWGELEQIVELGDIRGAVHCHTVYSDGKDSIEAMARAAQAQGLRYITITDHSPSAYYARGVTLDRLQQQWDEIAAVQEKLEIRILRGTESDILADGSLDYPDAVLEQLDVVVASIHSRLRMARDEMTKRLVNAMRARPFKIWGHALGRMLLQREPIDCDVLRVLDALAESRGAIEINGDPHRLDLPVEWIAAARARGIPFVISVDAHSTRGLAALQYGVTMARRAALPRSAVLNTLDADAFAARVRPR